MSAEVLGDNATELENVSWACDVDEYQTSMAEQTEICLQAEHGTCMYIYGMEDVAADDIKVADSFDDIKNNTGNCRFYIYDSREVLYYYHFNPEDASDKLGKLESGEWQERVEFYPEFSIWDRLFLNPESKYTCIGIYKTGELNKKTDKAGESCYFGFSVIKVGLKK